MWATRRKGNGKLQITNLLHCRTPYIIPDLQEINETEIYILYTYRSKSLSNSLWTRLGLGPATPWSIRSSRSDDLFSSLKEINCLHFTRLFRNMKHVPVTLIQD